MGFIRRICLIVLAILLCAWASNSSDEKKNSEEVLLGQVVDPASGEIDSNLVRNQTTFFFFFFVNVVFL